jgi:hypothetical protein
MVEVAAAEQVASLGWKIIAPIAGFLAAAAIGFAGGELMEHRGPGPTITILGHAFHPLGESLKAQLDDYKAGEPARLLVASNTGAKAQANVDKPAFDKWQAALAAARADASKARNTSAAAITKADAYTSSQTAVAFRLGRATCEDPNAKTSPVPGAPSVPCPAGGVCPDPGADFADIFNPGAYTPSSQTVVPAGGDGANPG